MILGIKVVQQDGGKLTWGNNSLQGSNRAFHFKAFDDPLSARCLYAEKGSVT